MQKLWFVGVICLFFSFSIMNGLGGCSASANKCTAVCSASAPAGGEEFCEAGDYYANCYAYDSEENLVMEDENTCEDPNSGGGGSGGGGSGGVDPLWCALNWWICDPFAL